MGMIIQSIFRKTIFRSASSSSREYWRTSRYKSAPMSRICFSAAMWPSSTLGSRTGETSFFFSDILPHCVSGDLKFEVCQSHVVEILHTQGLMELRPKTSIDITGCHHGNLYSYTCIECRDSHPWRRLNSDRIGHCHIICGDAYLHCRTCLSLPSMLVALMQVAVVYGDNENRSVDCIRERAGRIALPRSVSGAVGDETIQCTR